MGIMLADIVADMVMVLAGVDLPHIVHIILYILKGSRVVISHTMDMCWLLEFHIMITTMVITTTECIPFQGCLHHHQVTTS